ncbi:MAG: diaminopimelate epimerase [Candidatus Woesearchaeota archaeon]
MVKIKFTKMHGLGNDYLFIDRIREICKDNCPGDPSKLSKEMSDRHFGVGADGIVIMLPPEEKSHDASMRIFNADGSEAEMCGNAIRCIAKYLYDEKIVKKKKMEIETGAGIIRPKIIGMENGEVKTVEVDMGKPVVKGLNKEIEVNGEKGKKRFIGNIISMGNPHFVIFIKDLNDIDVEEIGPVIENHDLFPNRTNVEFVQVKNPKEIIMRVWERGSGVTLACGTGACASVVAGIEKNLIENDVTVHLLGGSLLVGINKEGHVIMTGPAEKVFLGEYDTKE